MKIYYDTIAEELLTEDEALEKARETVLRNQQHMDFLENFKNQEIWDMLTEEAQENIISRAIEEEFDEFYVCRNF